MKVVLKSVEQYAPELVEKTSHLTHGLVKLPGNVKMSSRKGNFLKAVDVLDMVSNALESEYHSKDSKVSLAATKYAFLKYKMGGNIIFDPQESVKMTGNSGPYLLYSAVRAKKILKNASGGDFENKIRESIRDNGSELRSEPHNDGREQVGERELVSKSSEHNLMKKLLEYKSVLEEAVTEMAPHKVANYLYELAQEFSRFYENCPVVGAKEEVERLKLVKVYLDTMTHGLNILGIEIPEEM
jgi:arginyl-tRNA synthetase